MTVSVWRTSYKVLTAIWWTELRLSAVLVKVITVTFEWICMTAGGCISCLISRLLLTGLVLPNQTIPYSIWDEYCITSVNPSHALSAYVRRTTLTKVHIHFLSHSHPTSKASLAKGYQRYLLGDRTLPCYRFPLDKGLRNFLPYRSGQ